MIATGPDWGEVKVICERTVRARWQYAKGAGMPFDDLVADMLVAVWEQHRRTPYDPDKSKLITWVMTVLGGRIRDWVEKGKTSEKRRGRLLEYYEREGEKVVYSEHDACVPETLSPIPARLNRGQGAKAGRIGHSPRAYAEALAYREQHGLPWRKLHERMRSDAALLRMWGFDRCPSLSNLRNARTRLKAWALESHN